MKTTLNLRRLKMNRFVTYLLAITSIVLLLNCGDNATAPGDDTGGGNGGGPTGRGGLFFDYDVEDENSASGVATPALGGTIQATGSNGVVYSLQVPPAAVEADETITITPLADLTITTIDSTVRDSSDCLQGALFEPDGLEFDEPAVLTITWPAAGLDCIPTGDYSIVLIDDTSAFYEIIPTEADLAARTLTCSLSHFSGYITDDMDDYEFLNYLIVETSKAGQGFPGWDVLAKLLSYAERAADNGWEDLRQLAVQGAHPIMRILADDAIAFAANNPFEGVLVQLLKYTESADYWGFDDIEADLRFAMDALVRRYATNGQAVCADGRHEEGKSMLRKAREWAMRGLIVQRFDEFLRLVDQMLADCGDISISLSASTDEVFNVAVDEGSLDRCAVNFTVEVTTPGGGSVADKDVTIRWTRDYSKFNHGTTDEGGYFSAYWTGAMILSTGGCLGAITEGFYAETYHNGEWYRTPVIEVTARALPLSTSITYNHSYSDDADKTCTASVMGEGTGFCAGGPGATCDGYFARTYDMSNNGATVNVLPDTLLMPACRASLILEIATHEASGITMAYVAGIKVADISGIFKNLMATSCPWDESCRLTGFSMPTCAIEATGSCGTWSAVWIPSLPGDALVFDNKGGGAFDPYVWSYDHSSGYGSSSMYITVGIDD